MKELTIGPESDIGHTDVEWLSTSAFDHVVMILFILLLSFQPNIEIVKNDQL